MNATPAPSITTWTRLEPRARGDALTPSLEARVYDPAWMLARQWQLAEFRGQDAAFPVDVSFTVQVQPLAGYQPAAGGAETIVQYPIEAFAWPEPAATPTIGASAESAAELVALLLENQCSEPSIAAIIQNHPLAAPPGANADPQGAAYLSLVAGRLPDPTQLEPILRAAVAAGGSLPAGLGVAAQDVHAVLQAAAQWLAEIDSFELSTPAPDDAWQMSRLEHRFSVTVGSKSGPPFSLLADRWPGRRIEWFDFDVPAQAAVSNPASLPTLPGVDPVTSTISGSGPPHPLSYPGAPNRRHWAFEDAGFNLAAVTVGTDDIARMLIVEFASVYGNDWYLQPIPLPAGALHTITQLTITNSFAETEVLGPVAPSIPMFGSSPTATPDWCIFRSTVTQADGSAAMLNGLFLPPSVVEIRSSPPIEEIVLIRDDVADVGWAIERTVLGADDRPLDRYSATAQRSPVTTLKPPADDGSTVRYLLETDVPVYCFPLVPDPTGQPILSLLVLRRVGNDGQSHDVPPLGELLDALRRQQELHPPAPLFDQELPLEGTTVRRRRFLMRGFDGEVLTWTGRERLIGGRYGSVPLAFDKAVAE